jgi:hypothetical protein
LSGSRYLKPPALPEVADSLHRPITKPIARRFLHSKFGVLKSALLESAPLRRRIVVPAQDFRRDRIARLWQDARVTATEAKELLGKFRTGQVSPDAVLRAFQAAPVADLGFAQVDMHRALRKGFPEVIFGAGKTPAQVAAIAGKLVDHEQRVLATRVGPEHARALKRKFKHAVYHELARCVTIDPKPLPRRPGTIAVICAGTSDLPVAEEAAVTAEIMGNRVERIRFKKPPCSSWRRGWKGRCRAWYAGWWTSR